MGPLSFLRAERSPRLTSTARFPLSAALSLAVILGGLLLTLAWLLPGHYLPWPLFQQEFVAALAGLMFCAAVAQARAPARWPFIALAALGLAAVPWLQFAAGQIRFLDDALLPSCYLLGFSLSVTVGASLAASARSTIGSQFVEALTASFVAAGILATGMATVQWLDLPSVGEWLEHLPPRNRPHANLGQPNHLASVLALAVAGTLRWHEVRRIGAFACGLTLTWLGWGIAITQSRTGWVFVVLLTLGCLLLHRRAGLRVAPWAPLAGLAGFVAVVLTQGPLQTMWQLDPLAGDATPPLRTAAGTRLMHWELLADAVTRAPLVGYGFNQVSHAQFALAPGHAASGENILHGHNLALDLAVYAGAPIAVAMVALLLVWIVRGLRLCRDGPTWFLWAGLLALLVHALLEYPLHYTYFLLPAGFLIGLLHDPQRDSAWIRPSASPASLWAPGLALAGMLAWIGVEYMHTEEALRRLRFAQARIGAVRLEQLSSPDVHLLRGWKAYHDASRLKLRPDMPEQELQLLRDVARRYTYAPALQRLAFALVMNGQLGEARSVLSVLCRIHPPFVVEAVREFWAERQMHEPPLRAMDFEPCDRFSVPASP